MPDRPPVPVPPAPAVPVPRPPPGRPLPLPVPAAPPSELPLLTRARRSDRRCAAACCSACAVRKLVTRCCAACSACSCAACLCRSCVTRCCTSVAAWASLASCCTCRSRSFANACCASVAVEVSGGGVVGFVSFCANVIASGGGFGRAGTALSTTGFGAGVGGTGFSTMGLGGRASRGFSTAGFGGGGGGFSTGGANFSTEGSAPTSGCADCNALPGSCLTPAPAPPSPGIWSIANGLSPPRETVYDDSLYGCERLRSQALPISHNTKALCRKMDSTREEANGTCSASTGCT